MKKQRVTADKQPFATRIDGRLIRRIRALAAQRDWTLEFATARAFRLLIASERRPQRKSSDVKQAGEGQ